jgi:hypothetical protein
MKDNNPPPADLTAPVVTDFSVPSSYTSLTIPVYNLKATDNIGVVGFKITESSTAPKASDTGWSTNAVTFFAFASEGAKSLYAWVKDAAGNISKSMSVSVVVNLNSSANIMGNTEIYGSIAKLPYLRAIPVTFSEKATITNISIYHDGGNGNLLLGVYSDQSNTPSSLLGESTLTTVNSSAGWQNVTLTSPVTVTPGQTVWLSWQFENPISTRYSEGTPGRAQSTEAWTGDMPVTFGASAIADYKYSIYCTYVLTNQLTGTLGETEVYNSIAMLPNLRAMPVTFSENATITNISIYHDGGNGSLLTGVYSDQSNAPSSLLGIATLTTVSSSAGWQNVTLTNPVTVTAGQTVWLSWQFQNPTSTRYSVGTPGRAQSTTIWTGEMPESFGASTNAGYRYSIFCTYFLANPQTGTLGETEVYNSVAKLPNLRAVPVTFSENATITDISIYHDGGVGNLLTGVYSDQSNKPYSLFGTATISTVNSSAGWQNVTLENPVTVTAGQTVWLSWQFQNPTSTRYDTGSPGRAQSTTTWTGDLPVSFGASTIAGYRYSINCSYILNSTILKKATIPGVINLQSETLPNSESNIESKNILSNESSIKLLDEIDFKLYPNPAKFFINIDFSYAPEDGTTIEIIDGSGRTVLKKLLESDSNRIDIQQFRSGIYFVKSFNGQKHQIKKLIIR